MSSRSSGGRRPAYDLLLIASQPDEIAPFIDSFEETDRTSAVHVVTDGDEALDFVHRRNDYSGVPQPDLVLLDLHVPGSSGEEVLTELDARKELSRIPVLVFTSSDADEDVARSYELNANASLTKPTTAAEFERLAESIENFWLEQVQMPPK